MNKLVGVKMKYSSPAVAPKGINFGWIYTLKRDSRGYYIDDGNLEQVYELSLIKQMFTPIGITWDEISTEEVEVKKNSRL
jgi:hypothetical protein